MQNINEYQNSILKIYASLFVPTEAKLSLVFQKRKFAILQKMLEETLIYLFDVEQLDEKKEELFLNRVYNFQLEYHKVLMIKFKYAKLQKKNNLTEGEKSLLKKLNSNYKKHNQIVHISGINYGQLDAMHSILSELDETTPNLVNNFKNFQSNKKFSNEEIEKKLNKYQSGLGKIFLEYYNAYENYQKIVKIYKEENNETKNSKGLHSSHTFVNEFFQFLTHYSYAYVAFNKQKKDEYITYIIENQRKSIGHLERAVLDIYKIISVILDKNNKIDTDSYLNLLNIRQGEIDNISNNIHDKINLYKNFIEKYLIHN